MTGQSITVIALVAAAALYGGWRLWRTLKGGGCACGSGCASCGGHEEPPAAPAAKPKRAVRACPGCGGHAGCRGCGAADLHKKL